MTTNIERTEETIRRWMPQAPDVWGECARQAVTELDNAGLLMPDLPEPECPGFWEVDGLEINLVDKDGEVNLDWRDGDYYRGETRSLWLSRKQVLAILAAAKLGKEKAC